MSSKQERADQIGMELDRLYPHINIPLDYRDAYTLLVAVLLSAQCTDKRVNEVTPALFRCADTPQKMVQLGQPKIRELIARCGLANNKSKAIARLSELLVRDHGGRVPNSFEELERLPGVGHKTASVVMVHHFGVPAFPVDTHIHRLAQRWKMTSGQSVRQTEADLKKLFPRAMWELRHLQLITYGREHCTARGCDGMKCPLCRQLFPNRKRPVQTKK